MSTNLIIGLVLLAAGIGLLVMGMNATHSIGEQASETFTGHYSDKTTWYIIGGIIGIVAGGGLAFLSARKK
jgi:hypothetical protein